MTTAVENQHADASRWPPRTGTATLRRAAAGPGEPLRTMLLPGLAGTLVAWAPFVDHAPAALEIWDAHLPWAAAPQPGWARYRDLGAWLSATIHSATARAGGPPRVLVAHSFAANVLLDVLCRGGLDPYRPAAVVLVSPFYRASAGEFDWETIEYYLTGFHRILDEGLKVGAGARIAPATRAAMARQVRERVGPYGWMRFFDLYLASPYLDAGGLDLPVLVTTGERDIAARPEDAKALATALPRARYELFEECGHFAMAEKPARFADLLADFVTGLPDDPITEPRS